MSHRLLLLSPPRVKRFVHFAKLLVGYVSINLRGGDGGVAEERLHAPDVGAVREQVGREGVAEGVGGDALGNACGTGIARDHPLHGARSERLLVGLTLDPARRAIMRDENKRGDVRTRPEIFPEPITRLVGHKHQSRLCTLAADSELFLLYTHLVA